MMKKLLSILVLVVFLVATVTIANAATSKVVPVPVSEGNKVTINISTNELLGGVALAIKFAEPGSEVDCIKADLFKGIAGHLKNNVETGFSDVVIDNQKKTILAYSISVQGDPIPREGVYLTLEFKGTGNVKIDTTTVCQQKGISLVNTKAENVDFEFNPIEFVAKPEQAIPREFSLSQNYPNPFNPATTISYTLPVNSYVNLTVYNTLGQKVKTLVDDQQTAGYKQVVWKGKNDREQDVASGIYFYRIKAGSFTKTAKMNLLK